MWELRQAILFLHIFSAIIWVGGIFFVGWGVFPAARKLPYTIQRKFFLSLMEWTHILFSIAGLIVILTGVLLGTVLGPLKSWHAVVSSTYGNIWLAALMIATISLLWGIFVAYPLAMKLFKKTTIWENADIGYEKGIWKLLIQYMAIESVEVIGFTILIYLMVII